MTEGKDTEPEYFTGVIRFLRATGVDLHTARIQGHGGKDPERVVKETVRLKEGDPYGYDECWSVVDVDQHSKLPGAIRLAAREGISLSVSNPCFEVWLVWHHEELRREVTSTDLRRKLRGLGCPDKHMPARFPFQALNDAIERARVACPDATPGLVGPNPSSMTHLVVASFMP